LPRANTQGLLHSALNFPFLDYLKTHYLDGKVNSEDQYITVCPVCSKRKLYFDVNKMKGVCFHCSNNLDNNIGIFSNLVNIIMFTESIDYEAAIESIKSVSFDGSIDSAVVEITKAVNIMNVEIELIDDDYLDIPIQCEIPKKILPNMKLVAAYLRGRKHSMAVRIIELFPVWFSKAKYLKDGITPFLKDRMIWEVHTNNSYAWLAYYIGDNPVIKKERKTLNPAGSVLSCMLHGYNYVKNEEKPLLVNEGVFDTYRCILYGYNAVSSFGKNLSSRQITLLNATKATEIVLCYDGDKAGFKGMWSVVKKWRNNIDKPLSMMTLPYCDPDDATKDILDSTFKERRAII
jgi:hypothetical protein